MGAAMAEIYVQVEVAEVEDWNLTTHAVGEYHHAIVECRATFDVKPTLGQKIHAMFLLDAPIEIYWDREEAVTTAMEARVMAMSFVDNMLDGLSYPRYHVECVVPAMELLPR